jgi:hypothetical protein
MRPPFDREEDYLIAYYRQRHAAGNGLEWSGDLGILLAGAILVGTGLFKDDLAWTIVGFAIVAYRLVQGMLSSAKYNRTLGSIIEKYEKALEEKRGADSRPAGE